MAVHKKRLAIGAGGLALLLLSAFLLLRGHNFEVLNSAGSVAAKERSLLYLTVLLSLVVVVPVYAMTIAIVFKYREGRHAKYSPSWDHNLGAEVAWWAIPGVIIAVLSVVTWNSSHALDPYRKLAAESNPPMTVQVVALDWRWLFIYPAEHLATINLLEIPVDTPVTLHITSDAPMNSLWIPQLSGQIYAMPGMDTQLNLTAAEAGDYRGSSANISGAGFAGMTFTTRATSAGSFDSWSRSAAKSARALNWTTYAGLSKPSQNTAVTTFKLADQNLFGEVINKYMSPGAVPSSSRAPTNNAMNMTGAMQ